MWDGGFHFVSALRDLDCLIRIKNAFLLSVVTSVSNVYRKKKKKQDLIMIVSLMVRSGWHRHLVRTALESVVLLAKNRNAELGTMSIEWTLPGRFARMFLHRSRSLLSFPPLHLGSCSDADRMPRWKTTTAEIDMSLHVFSRTWRRPRSSRSLRIFTQTFSSRLNRTRSSGSSTDDGVVAVV